MLHIGEVIMLSGFERKQVEDRLRVLEMDPAACSEESIGITAKKLFRGN